MSESINIVTSIKAHRITQLKLSNSEKENKVKEALSCFELSSDKIFSLANLFSDLLVKGLQYDGTSPFFMQNTFVFRGLEGNENGTYLALDFGGTNYRVLLVELKNGRIEREEVNNYHVPDHLRVGSGADLFEFFAKNLADFTEKHGIMSKKLPLGFTFSFPTEQYALDSAHLIKWGCKYNVSGVEGHDVVKLLKEAISKIPGLEVSVIAVVNDTTGVLIRGTLIDNETAIALILGTGSNACYFEKTNNISGWKGEEKEVVLNIEWGTFSDHGRFEMIKTKYDDLVDRESLYPNHSTFDKYVGGEFFGKIVSAILVDLTKQNLIFDGRLSKALEKSHDFKTRYISEIEEDNLQGTNVNTRRIIVNELGIDWYSDNDITTLKYICEIVSIRMGLLASIALSEIIKRMDRQRLTIACDGSLYKYHPRLRDYILDFTSALINYKTQIKLVAAYDGSGVGAAMIAAIACKNK